MKKVDTTMSLGPRRSGITTEQMVSAPTDSVYVWPNGLLRYPIDLARNLGRNDLRIVSVASFEPQKLLGMKCGVVVDHAVSMTHKIWDAIEELQRYQIQVSFK